MKKKFLLLGVLLVFLFGSLAVYGQDAVYLSTAKEKKYKDTLPELTIKNFKESGVRITYKYKGTVLAPMNVEGDDFYIPHIYGYAHMREVGSPMLPAKNHHIAVPAGATVGIEIEDIHFEEHSVDRMVHPAQAPPPDCQGCPEPPWEINRAVYETDADFPANVVKILETDTYMGIPVAVIQVRPVQFNPVTKTMKVYSKIKFKVTFSGERCSFSPYGKKNSKHANQMVRNAVLNRDSIPDGLASSSSLDQVRASGANDYIIIVHSNFLSAAQDLATWKRQMGYRVEIVSQSSWTTTQVDDALKTRYNSWTPKPSFFLLFGDQGDVPAEYTSRYTDLYYAEMEGSGYKPEMAYGRIFPSSATDAQVIVDKIINYEKNPPTLSSFYTNALSCAYYQDSDQNSYADRRFAHTAEDIRNHVMGQGYGVNRVYVTESSVDPLYYNNGNYSPPNTPVPTELRKPGFPWDGDYNDIINYIDAGRFLVWHRDHGGETLWGDPYFTTTHIGQLNNGSLLPIVMSVNCLTGKFVISGECFCEKFLRRSGGGCVGIFGASEVSYSGYNDGYACGAIDAIWPDPQIDPQFGSGGAGNPIPAHDAIYTMGDVLNHSKMAMEYLWGTSQTTWELHHYYGDPAMQIWTAVPTNATASHASSLPVGATSLEITASNCGGGIATLVYEDTLVGKATLSGGGTGTITFSALSGNEPNATLTVSKHNYKPYIATIPVASGPPTAAFTSDTVSVMAGGVVNFTDQSTSGPTSWSWTFEGGTPSSSTTQNPSVTYNTPGTFDVSLTVTNSSGSDDEIKTDYITVTALQPPVADFTASSTSISIGGSVTFTDASTNNPTSWSWSFEGGTPSTSTAQNPTVTYNTVGTFDVTLTATNAAGSDAETKIDYINVAAIPYCDSSANDQSYEYIAGVAVADLNNSSGASGYTDFTYLTAHLTQGDSASVSLTPGFVSSSYTEYWKIWIDYNGDHDFEDSGEEVFAGSGSSVVTGSFTVPGTAPLGDTRMRVSMSYSTYPPICGTFTYGEVEDYTANISGACTQYTLTTNVVGNGSITLDPPGGTYCEGTVVTLTAVPDAGWQFDGWSGDLSGTQNPTTITMGSNKNVTATFSQIPVQQYTLTVNTVGQGSVTLDPPGGTYDEGTVVTLTAVPDSGWKFDNWSGDLSGSANPTTITMNANKTVTANFSELGPCTEIVGYDTVFSLSTTTANRRAMPFTMPENGEICSVTMYHNGGSGSMIMGVYDGESLPDNRLGVTATTPVSGTTGWQTIDLTSPAFVAGGSTVWLAWVYESNPGMYYETGSPGRAHSSDTWSGGMPDPFGSSTTADYIYSIYANYTPAAPPQYTLTVNIVGNGSVALNPPGGVYDAGTVVTLTATADTGWLFSSWSGDLSGSANPTTITMTSNKTVTATFIEEGTTGTVGNETVFGSTSVSTYRRAMPFTMPENGTITSVTMYHEGGSGGLILGVYDGEGTPQNRLGVTPTTTINSSAGWQTINLTGSAFVSGGATVWLAWVYESNPGIAYEIGSPGRYQSGDTWSGGMPDPFGTGSQSDFLYSIYATYNK